MLTQNFEQSQEFTDCYYKQYQHDLYEYLPGLRYKENQLRYASEDYYDWDRVSSFIDRRFLEFQQVGSKTVSWKKETMFSKLLKMFRN